MNRRQRPTKIRSRKRAAFPLSRKLGRKPWVDVWRKTPSKPFSALSQHELRFVEYCSPSYYRKSLRVLHEVTLAAPMTQVFIPRRATVHFAALYWSDR